MNNSFYNDFAARFAAGTLTSLVETFNSQVGNRGFNSMRAAHDRALIGSNNIVVFLTICISYANNCFTL